MAVDTKQIQWEQNFKTWQLMRDVLSSNVAKYVPMLHDQTKEEWQEYTARPSFFNATQRTSDALLGLIFSKHAELTDSAELQKIYDNITLDDDTIEDFAKAITKEVLAVGRGGVLIDMPSIDRSQFSASQIEMMNLRAYARLYKAENIINWRYTNVNGIQYLSLLVLEETFEYQGNDEFSVEIGTRWRVLDLFEGRYRQRIYVKQKDTTSLKDEILPMANGKHIAYIPFVFFGVNELKGNVETPPLLDLAKVNLSHFKNDVDLEHGAHFTALPTPCISGYNADPNAPAIKIGSTEFLTFNDPNAKAYYMEFTGNGLETIQNIIALKEKRMAVLGARLLLDEKKTAEATETVAMRSSGERAVLINIAITISSGIKKVLQIIAEWENIKQEIVYNLNTDYNLSTLDAQLLAQIMAGVQSSTIPLQVLYHNMKEGELIPDDMDYETYQANIETATPQMSVSFNTKALKEKLEL